jgi:hypothetical protein
MFPLQQQPSASEIFRRKFPGNSPIDLTAAFSSERPRFCGFSARGKKIALDSIAKFF